MTAQDIKRRLNIIRYGGIALTVVVLGVSLAYVIVTNNYLEVLRVSGVYSGPSAFDSLLIYIIGFTVFAAVMSVIVYFGYRAYLMNKISTSTATKTTMTP